VSKEIPELKALKVMLASKEQREEEPKAYKVM
jgi:hypothetical protein